MDKLANERQIGGDHYKVGGEEHWDRVERLQLDYFQGQITKYVERAWQKNGIQDLEKARHFLEKYIEIHKAKGTKPSLLGKLPNSVQLSPYNGEATPGYVNQDRK